MNILFISNRSAYFKSAFGGAETSLKLIAEEMANRGHNVYYLTKRFEHKLELGVKITSVNSVNVISVNFQSVEYMLKIKKYRLPLINRIKRFINEYQSSIFSKTLSKLISEQNIDIVYCFYELNVIQKLINIKNRVSPIKIVMRMAGYRWYDQCITNTNLKKNYEFAFNSVDSINFIHDGMKEVVLEKFNELNMNVQVKHSFTCDIGTAANIGRPSIYSKSEDRDFKIIMVARFSDYSRRQDILVECMRFISNELPIKLVLVGEGINKSKIENMVKDYQLEDKIEIKPFYKQKELWDVLLNANLLCHACDHEGVSKIIIESMSIGLPVLASNIDPINKYVIDGCNGFLVDNDANKWAKEIVKLYHNQDLLVDISHNAIEYIKNRYDPKQNILVYEDYFNEVIQL